MVMSWSKMFLRARGAASVAASRSFAPGEDVSGEGGERGFRVRAPQDIVAAHPDMLARLRLHAALEEPRFAQCIGAPLLRLAEQVNVLPAAPEGSFACPMGLYRAALESAFFAFQAADGRIFTAGEGVERRHALEGHWRLVCFFAGLMSPVGGALARIRVVDAQGRPWKRHHAGVTAWARSEARERLFVAWNRPAPGGPDAAGPLAVSLLAAVVGAEILQTLEDASAELLAALYRLTAGPTAPQGPIAVAQDLLVQSRARIEQRDATRPLACEGAASAEPAGATSPVDPQVATVDGDPVPADVRTAINNKTKADLLARVVLAWRARGEGSTVMRRVEHGAAIELAFLASQVPDVAGWVDTLAHAGFVHAPALKPGLRIQPVAIVEGRPPVPALVLSNLACRRLGL